MGYMDQDTQIEMNRKIFFSFKTCGFCVACTEIHSVTSPQQKLMPLNYLHISPCGGVLNHIQFKNNLQLILATRPGVVPAVHRPA